MLDNCVDIRKFIVIQENLTGNLKIKIEIMGVERIVEQVEYTPSHHVGLSDRPFNNRKTRKGRNRKQVIISHSLVKLGATYTKSGKLMREATEYLKPVRKLITHKLG